MYMAESDIAVCTCIYIYLLEYLSLYVLYHTYVEIGLRLQGRHL